MKTWYLLPFVMVFGVLVGRWLPKDELRAPAGGQKPVAEQPAPKTDALNNLTRMVQIPDRASRPRRPLPQDDVPVADEADEADEDMGEEEEDEADEDEDGDASEDLRARIDEAKGLWLTRVEIARAQMLDKLEIVGTGQEAAFDGAINQMNAAFANTIQELADVLRDGVELTPELGVRVFSAMSAAMVAAYEDLAQVVPPERQGDVSDMLLTDFIDPGVVEPLIGVQDKFRNMRPWGGER